MAIDYVKFQRGPEAAYNRLKKLSLIDENTLYFIYNADDETTGTLYLGSKAITTGNVDLSEYVKDEDLKFLEDNLTLINNDIQNLKPVISNKVDKVFYQVPIIDEQTGQETLVSVEGTLLSPIEKKKIEAIKLNQDGTIKIEGSISIDNIQGIEGSLNETYFSEDVNKKLNFINDVDKEVFSVEKSVLNLKAVPAKSLIPVLGDLTKLPHAQEGKNLVDEINHLTNLLTWGTI